MFKVRWCEAAPSKDQYGFQIVNLNKEIYKDEKFMFASQAHQCFYVADPQDENSWVVIRKPPRSLYDAPDAIVSDRIIKCSEPDDVDTPIEHEPNFSYTQNVHLFADVSQVRPEVPNIIAHASVNPGGKKSKGRTVATSETRARSKKVSEAMSVVMTRSKAKQANTTNID